MSKEDKRVPRKELPKLDFSTPIDITLFGTSKDPCFGKLYDATQSECKQCGDCEACAIVQSQYQNLMRDSLEKENRYIDREMPDMPKGLDRDKMDKSIVAFLKKKGGFVLNTKVAEYIAKEFDLQGGESRIEIRKAIVRLKSKIVQNKKHTKIKIR